MTVSFKVLNKENAAQILHELIEKLGSRDEVSEIFRDILENLSDGCEYAVSSHSGCILLRIYDGEYVFPYPIGVVEEANELLAVEEIRRYAVKEEIPLVLCDLPREALSDILPLFRHASIDAADLECDYFTLRPVSELSLTDDISSERMDNVELTLLRPEDETEYARLCRDVETNRYWGYDFRADAPECDDSYFLATAAEERKRGVAVSFAVRNEGEFVGEAILYSFDLKGGAQCAVRILPEYRRKRLATNALTILSRIAAQMGLLYMYATVNCENEASCEMCFNFFDSFVIDGANNIYLKNL